MSKNTVESIMLDVFKAEGKANQALINLKRFFNVAEYCKCIEMMTNNRIYSNALNKFYTTTDVNELMMESTFPILSIDGKYGDIYKDIRFMLALFQVHKSRVMKFIELKEEFEDLFLNADFTSAGKKLDEIYEICGLSFWYIEAKMMVLNEISYAQYKEYYLDIRNQCMEESVRSYIRLLKRKVNMRTRQIDFRTFYLENFGKVKKTEPDLAIFVDYVEFMCFENDSNESSLESLSEERIRNLVIMMHHLTIADSFLLFNKLILSLVIRNKNVETEEIYNDYRKLFVNINDERGTLYNRLKGLFVKNELIDCRAKCEEILKVHSSWFEVLDIYIKVLVISDTSIKEMEDVSPLQKLVRAFALCYVKDDGTKYASGYIDLCDRYLRSFSYFSAYYELLSIVSDRVMVTGSATENFFKKKILSRKFINSEGFFCVSDPKGYIVESERTLGTLYSCEWNTFFRKEFPDSLHIEVDEVSLELTRIDNNMDYTIEWQFGCDNKRRIYYEEHVVNLFQHYLNLQDYSKAIHIYIDVYFKSKFMVLRLDTKTLNNNLPEIACESLLADLDFFIYANITDLNKRFDDISSQTVVDSFAAILESYGISKPSEIAEKEKLDKKIIAFCELCCSEILSESPCDLYDEEKYVEQLALLNKITEYTHDSSYMEWISRIEQEYDYFKISHTINKKEWVTDKIIADWIYLKNDINIMSSYNDLKNYSSEELINDERMMGLYKDVFVLCKKDYVRQINSQMGTTIRHGILEAEFVQLLKRYNLFIPDCDKNDKEKLFTLCKYIQTASPDKKELVWNILQMSCLKLFEDIERMKRKYIFFTHKKEYLEFTSLYLTDDEMKTQVSMIGEIDSEVKFINEIKKMLDRVLTSRLPNMKRKVMGELRVISNRYIKNIQKKLEEQDLAVNNLSDLQKDIDETIMKIGMWFNLTHNGDQLYDLNTYLLYQERLYSEICFIYSKESKLIKLNIIRCIEIIFKNLIRNVELHSGYIANLKEAEAKIEIEVKNDLGSVKIRAVNKIASTVNPVEILEAVNKINRLLYKEEQIEIEERHGLGYKRIATFIQDNFKQPLLHADLTGEWFSVNIAFNYGEEI